MLLQLGLTYKLMSIPWCITDYSGHLAEIGKDV